MEDASCIKTMSYFSRAKTLNTNVSTVTLPVFLHVVISSHTAHTHDVTTCPIVCTLWFMLSVSSWNTKQGFPVLKVVYISDAVLFPWLRRTDSSIHARSALFNISPLQDAFWKGATLNTVLSRRVMATTFITATCKSKGIKHRKCAVKMDKKFFGHTLV